MRKWIIGMCLAFSVVLASTAIVTEFPPDESVYVVDQDQQPTMLAATIVTSVEPAAVAITVAPGADAPGATVAPLAALEIDIGRDAHTQSYSHSTIAKLSRTGIAPAAFRHEDPDSQTREAIAGNEHTNRILGAKRCHPLIVPATLLA